MNLYIVTCNGGWDNQRTIDVYVLAEDPKKAEEFALMKMRELEYPYTAFVSRIDFIASTENYKSRLLVSEESI